MSFRDFWDFIDVLLKNFYYLLAVSPFILIILQFSSPRYLLRNVLISLSAPGAVAGVCLYPIFIIRDVLESHASSDTVRWLGQPVKQRQVSELTDSKIRGEYHPAEVPSATDDYRPGRSETIVNAVLALKRHTARLPSAYLLLIICCAALICASQQAASEENISDGCVGAEQNKAFELRLARWSPQRIVTKFITRPDADADLAQVKRHVTYWNVMGAYVSLRSSTQCLFVAGMDTSLVPYFEFSTIVAQRERATCLPSICVQTLSDIFLSAVVDRQSFSAAVDRRVYFTRDTEPVITTPTDSVRSAEKEAFRLIYPSETRERIIVDDTAEDYQSIDFQQFTAWLLKQQSALRAVLDGDAPPIELPTPDSSLQLSPPCPPGPAIPIEQLNVDHHGWGHQSIIMINYSVGGERDNRVISRMLRAFCPHYEVDPTLDDQPQHEMADRMSCYTIRFNERTQWLVSHSKRVQQSGADVQRYAQAMAKTLNAARCSDLKLRIIIANFLQQK